MCKQGVVLVCLVVLEGVSTGVAALHATGDVFSPILAKTSVNPVLDTGYSGNPVQKFFVIDNDTRYTRMNLYSFSSYTDTTRMDNGTYAMSTGYWFRTAVDESGWHIPNYYCTNSYSRFTTPSYYAWSPVWAFIAPQDGQYKLDGSFYGQTNTYTQLVTNAQRCEVFAFRLAGRPCQPIDNITLLDNSTYKLTTRTLAMHTGDMLCIAGINPNPYAACGGSQFYLNGGPNSPADNKTAGNVSLTLSYYMYCPTLSATVNPVSDPFPGGTGDDAQVFYGIDPDNGSTPLHNYGSYTIATKMDTFNAPTKRWYRANLHDGGMAPAYFPATSYATLQIPAWNKWAPVWAFVAPRNGTYKLEGTVYYVTGTYTNTISNPQRFEVYSFTGSGHSTYTALDNVSVPDNASYALTTRALTLSIGDMICIAGINPMAGGCGGGYLYLNGGVNGKEGDVRITYLGSSDNASALTVAQEITAEALRPNDDPIGRPLPLAATWATGSNNTVPSQFTPDYQISQIDNGHYIIPSFVFPWIGATIDNQTCNNGTYGGSFRDYFTTSLGSAQSRNLPVSINGTQWDGALTHDPFLSDPPASNANMLDNATGQVAKFGGGTFGYLDPMGPIAPWKTNGYNWMAQTSLWSDLAALYPLPPRVFLVSNNEATKMAWTHDCNNTPAYCDNSSRYVSAYGIGTTEEFKRTVVGNGWTPLYRAMQTSMLAGLDTSGTWAQNALFVGYNAFAPSCFRRWDKWGACGLSINNRIDPNPLMWDGASPSYYDGTSMLSDYQVQSMQVECQNWVFMLDEARKLNPDYWFEMSVWDGNDNVTNKVPAYLNAGQTYTPDRYKGWLQYGMWIIRPRVVREYRGWIERRDCNGSSYGQLPPYTNTGYTNEQFFLALCAAVDHVHTSPTLRSFWRQGSLVQNTAETHPYQNSTYVPTGYDDATINGKTGRWFMLTASANPARSDWALSTQLNVYALALVKGTASNRKWLVYAHAPLGDNTTNITVPIWGTMNSVTVPRAGAFWMCTEGNPTPQPVTD